MILVDTGPLVAAADADEARHEVCAEALDRAEPPLLVSGPVIAEVCYMLVRAGGPGSEAPFLRSFAEGFLTLVHLEPEDLLRAADLVEQYADLPLDGADGCTVALAERLNVADVATIDNDFRIVVPVHTAAFRIVPESLP